MMNSKAVASGTRSISPQPQDPPQAQHQHRCGPGSPSLPFDSESESGTEPPTSTPMSTMSHQELQHHHERLLSRLSGAILHDPTCAVPLIRFLCNRINSNPQLQVPTLLAALDLVEDWSNSARKPTSLRPQESPVSVAIAFRQPFQPSPPPLPPQPAEASSGQDRNHSHSNSQEQQDRLVPCHDVYSPSPSPPPSDLAWQNEATIVSDQDDESQLPNSPAQAVTPVSRMPASALPHSSSPLESFPFPRSQRPSRSSLSSTGITSSAPYPGPSRSAVPLPAAAPEPVAVQPFEAPAPVSGSDHDLDPHMESSDAAHDGHHHAISLPSATLSGLPISKLIRLLHVYAINLPHDMDEFDLRRSLRRFGKIDDLRLPKLNRNEPQHAGYAYVKFATADAASKICEQSALGKVVVKGHPITITMRREEVQHMERPTASLFLANVWDVTEEDLVGIFHLFGEVERCDYLGDRGMAYIHFTDLNAARTAIMHLQGLTINAAYIRVEYARPSKSSQTLVTDSGSATGRRNFTLPPPPPPRLPLPNVALPRSSHLPLPAPPPAYPNHPVNHPTHSQHGHALHAPVHAQLPLPPPPPPPASHVHVLYYQQPPQQHWYAHQPLEQPSYAGVSGHAQTRGHGKSVHRGRGRGRQR
ncbi:hypothetical protein BCR44DRAFT_219715 [Catenaria anguillulae PL171]|uniref:RRM domain-containing protein n=1 Tax=Catenaria anguillulae PL171 TaxID=765915 RepID=A0A1Y2HTH7_9FUNG|nr:hypothetical protein BCR44DRAFT_219715 [Catenaria anguillulae PL171]